MLNVLPDSSARERKILRELFRIFPRLRSGSEPFSVWRLPDLISSGVASLRDPEESINTSTSREEPSSFKHVCKWLTSIACAGVIPKIVVKAINDPAINAERNLFEFLILNTVQQLE